jgi:hypothetical protein
VAAPGLGGQALRLGTSAVPVHEDPGPNARLETVEASQAGVKEVEGGQAALAKVGGRGVNGRKHEDDPRLMLAGLRVCSESWPPGERILEPPYSREPVFRT